MHRCEMEVNGRLALPCDERAMFKVENHWYCQFHADALQQASERWSGVNWFPLTYDDTKEQADNPIDDDGRFWDDDTEE
jgi:hypothetical protein